MAAVCQLLSKGSHKTRSTDTKSRLLRFKFHVSLTSCVTLRISLKLSEPQDPYLQNGNYHSAYTREHYTMK